MPEIQNQSLPLTVIVPSPDNYNRHPAEQVQRIALSLREFGQPKSITVWDRGDGCYEIVAGHGVHAAATSEGWADLRCDVLPHDYPPEKRRAYLVADNELAHGADPDLAALAQLLESARVVDIPLEALGHSDESLQTLLDDLAKEALGDGSHGSSSSLPQPKEFDESVEDDLPTELCQQCGRLCLKSKR